MAASRVRIPPSPLSLDWDRNRACAGLRPSPPSSSLAAGSAGRRPGSGHVVTDDAHRRRLSQHRPDGRRDDHRRRSASRRRVEHQRRRQHRAAHPHRVRSDGVLVVSSKHSYKSNHMLHVRIGTPALDGVTLTGSGHLHRRRDPRERRSRSTLSGAGPSILAGTDGHARHDALRRRLGRCSQHLVARDAHVTLSGTGSLHVYVTGTLDASGERSREHRLHRHTRAHVKSHVSGVGTITEA